MTTRRRKRPPIRFTLALSGEAVTVEQTDAVIARMRQATKMADSYDKDVREAGRRMLRELAAAALTGMARDHVNPVTAKLPRPRLAVPNDPDTELKKIAQRLKKDHPDETQQALFCNRMVGALENDGITARLVKKGDGWRKWRIEFADGSFTGATFQRYLRKPPKPK